jgi:hypothetical protein
MSAPAVEPATASQAAPEPVLEATAPGSEAAPEHVTQRTGFAARVLNWLIRRISTEVPPAIALCEYDCRKGQCLQGEFEHCERRLASMERLKAS